MRAWSCLHVFVSKKMQKRKPTGSSAQNIFGDPRYSQVSPWVSPWVSVGFPGKKRSSGLRCRPPHACIHVEKFMYPLALVSGAPHKAYIFRFNTPTNNTFPASSTHTCLILRDYPPLVPIHFWQKVRGLTPRLCSYIIRNVGSAPPTPEPVRVGDVADITKVSGPLYLWFWQCNIHISYLGSKHAIAAMPSFCCSRPIWLFHVISMFQCISVPGGFK